MRHRWIEYAALLVLAAPAMAQTPIDLTTLDRDMAGPRTQVLVLGSVHLSQMKVPPPPQALDAMLDRLAAYQPQIITIETIPGESCDLAARHPSVYGPDFCPNTDAAKAATGLDVPAAIAEINQTLKQWPSQPEPRQRRRLAAAFLAANDRASAYVQWLQLPEAERRVGDGLDEALVTMLKKIATRSGEGYQIASRLAARLGLPRVYPVDDHSGDNIDVADGKALGLSVEQAWKDGGAEIAPVEKQEDELSKGADLLPLYRYLNRPDNLAIRADVNVRAAMRAKSPQHYPRLWVAGWEIRNLRMVANIYQTFRERPGARVLSIVGSSHKPWFDGWLGQMQGVEIVDVEKVLK